VIGAGLHALCRAADKSMYAAANIFVGHMTEQPLEIRPYVPG
jgi:nucleoside permease NupC